jgi:catechol 2,3-dioxygenase-like lactoylglutathione lyase family enzyme
VAVDHPRLGAVVLDTTDARSLAEFYRELLGLVYRPGDERPPAGDSDPRGQDWLVLRDERDQSRLAFQQVAEVAPSTWPHPAVPQQIHLDLTVPTTDDLTAQHDRALALGATVLEDRFENPEEPLYVFADPAGHPFCIFVAPDAPS